MRNIFVLALMLLYTNFYGQINQDEQVVDGNALLEQKAQEFKDKFELHTVKPLNAKMLDACEIRVEPGCDSEKTGFIIQAGEFIEIYKYYGEEKCWAANYKGNWGFVSDTKVFPVSDKVVPSKISKYDVPPQMKTSISPKYPKEAKKKDIHGKVFIKVYIDETGTATEAIVLEGIDELNQAAIDAVLKAKYIPAKLDNEDVGVWVNLSIAF